MFSVLVLIKRSELRIYGDEGSREDAFTEQIREQIRDADCSSKGVRDRRFAEIMGDGALTNQAGKPAEKDAESNAG